jgi:hypothetical protein
VDLTLPGSGRTISQTFSVFDYDTGKYRYYTCPVAAPPLTGHYRAPRNRTPEGLALQLPPAAKLVGDGDKPQGVIATTPEIHTSVGETPQIETSGQKAFVYVLGISALLFIFNQYAKETTPPRPTRLSQRFGRKARP